MGSALDVDAVASSSSSSSEPVESVESVSSLSEEGVEVEASLEVSEDEDEELLLFL